MIAVTGATGHLGQLVIEGLLKHVPAEKIVAAVRSPEKAAGLGVQAREADYNRPETLAKAFAGVETLLLISSNDLEARLEQHKAAIDAAKAAGAKRVAYTSLLKADTTPMRLAETHLATEKYLQASGLAWTMLRNSWYLENHTASIGATLAHGAVLGAAKDGRFASASRKDYADAAVAVLTGSGHEGKIYELGGDTSFSLAEYAAEIQKQSSKPVIYNNLPEAEYAGLLVGFGLPEAMAKILADAETAASNGALDTDSKDLSTLIGHATTPMAEAVRAALAG